PVARTISQLFGSGAVGPWPASIRTAAPSPSRSISARVGPASGAPSPIRRMIRDAPSSASSRTARAAAGTPAISRSAAAADGKAAIVLTLFSLSIYGLLIAKDRPARIDFAQEGGRKMAMAQASDMRPPGTVNRPRELQD